AHTRTSAKRKGQGRPTIGMRFANLGHLPNVAINWFNLSLASVQSKGYSELIEAYWHRPATSENPIKNSRRVKSHDLGGQFTSPLREITIPSNRSCKMFMVSFAVWPVPQSF
ncbi:hypothetical protein J6590_104192, partial [Homalodisca vitripennis]